MNLSATYIAMLVEDWSSVGLHCGLVSSDMSYLLCCKHYASATDSYLAFILNSTLLQYGHIFMQSNQAITYRRCGASLLITLDEN